MFQPGEWAWSLEHQQVCRVVETQDLWGDTLYRVWVPAKDTIVRVRSSQLRPPAESAPRGSAWISYLTAAARVSDALTQDVLLAPIEASVIPLPHQIRVLSRAVSSDRVRYLLADEVGLGKTIEAGLIMRELKLRGMVRRTLVVTPKGLVTQWIAEMRTHFDEEFRLFIPSDFSAFRRIAQKDNVWETYDQVVCPMDSVKPVDGRRGWSRDQLAEYNRERFEDLIAAGWDLIIVDEAHRLGGSTDQVARYRLGRGLAEAAPYLLLLSATPHQGKTDAFHRLISLVDERAFPDPDSISRERVQPYVIRTEKRRAIDAEGQPLFKPRNTRLVPIAWGERHSLQRTLYEAVTEYVREGYNQAIREKKSYIGFLMILMQRLVTSSTRAIRTTLGRRLQVLQAPSEQLLLFPDLSEEEWADLDGQEQIETLLTYDIPWNPMRLEQRIGRVDRIGQERTVRAVNFVVQDTVEYRVREVLEEKLAVILEEFGVDKTGDILDSAQAGQLFDDLYVEAMLQPDALNAKVDSVVSEVREQGRAVRESGSILGSVQDLDPRDARSLMTHPLPHWIERMTISYVQGLDGSAVRKGRTWRLRWPDGEEMDRVVFTMADANRVRDALHLTLDHPKVRNLAKQIPRVAPGQTVPSLCLSTLPAGGNGLWSLWRIAAHAGSHSQVRIMPLFVHDDGRILAPTARFVWDQMLSETVEVAAHLEGDAALELFQRVEASAREHGQQIYQELVRTHRTRLARERERGEYAFNARRQAIERIGLPAVRHHRLTQLAAEERAWREQLDHRAETSPELVPLLLVRVERGGDGE
ncbi:MAG: DEAD/DEAH box helicase [Candidatus Eisenbacteria sp.]|nr:DEAD/DEAH box helicase [Candidatus Eisenbacteria bacterium]